MLNGNKKYMKMKQTLKSFIPPIVMQMRNKLKAGAVKNNNTKFHRPKDKSSQELDIYWTDDMANQLENWGKNHTWNEIECLLVNCSGKVLDIACGTGVNIVAMSKFEKLEIHGFDISDFLIQKSLDKGIPAERLKVMDATKTTYADNEFDYSYSIGSLEHFTEEGIEAFLNEASRYTSKASFHMIPTSESDTDEGWLRTNQSFHNNSVAWWLKRYTKYFSKVYVINSGYKDQGLSYGKWFICVK
jgi:ubiquinone/menaquinone biosynthesis C-methylase UbiE